MDLRRGRCALGDLVEITDGLDEGDLVAVAGHFALAHEAPVQVVE